MPPREGNDVGCNRMPAARGKDISPPLHSLLAAAATQRFDLFLVSLDLSSFRHLIDQAGNEKSEALLLLADEELVADLIALGGIVGVRRLLVLEHREDHAVGAAADWTADLSRLHSEGHRGRSGHRAHVRNLP